MPDNPRRPDVITTIGAFDGIHRGHQELLRQLVARAATLGCRSLAVTFDPHPDMVLYPERRVAMLSDREQKQDLMRALGIDTVHVFEFTRELSLLGPDQFIALLQRDDRLRELWVGSDFAMGHGRSGTIAALVDIGSAEDFALHVVPPVRLAGEVISSTSIRASLAQGDVDGANELLGHRYQLAGLVVYGAGRGRSIDVPTANVEVPATRAMPADGVYAALVPLDGRLWPAVANLGGRPTFDETERLLEVHLLDFAGQLYGRRLCVDFVRHLRAVRRFASLDDLRAQIARDIQAARALPELQMAGGQPNQVQVP